MHRLRSRSFRFSTRSMVFLVVVTVLSACDIDAVQPHLDTEDVFILSVGDGPTRADGISTRLLSATIPENTATDNRTVKFTAESGTFPENAGKAEIEVRTDSDHVATAELRAGLAAGETYVTATVGDVVQRKKIEFVKSLAQEMSLETSTAIARENGTSKPKITAFLRRKNEDEKVSDGIDVEFTATQVRGGATVPAGHITDKTPSKDGSATAVFAADHNASGGEATIIVTTRRPDGTPLIRTITVKVQ